MVKCEVCNKEMKTAKGCKFNYLVDNNNKKFRRIKYGEEKEDWGADKQSCGDCACKKGYLHHEGCDIERCPKCDGQLIGCGCGFPKLSI